jgi:purine-binding chemotaxis protein CheW
MAKTHRRKLKQIGRAAAMSAEERLRYILDERTERLAARSRRDAAPAATDLRRVLVCTAGRERFGLPVDAVTEVLPQRPCVPGSAALPALIGHFGRAGHLVSVIDLGRALGLVGPGGAGEDGHFVLLRRDHPRIALRVDRAEDVMSVTPLNFDGTSGLRMDAVVGLGRAEAESSDLEGAISLLDIDRLLRPFLTSSPVSGA